MDILKDMPRPFVSRLREIRKEQLEARKKQDEQLMNQNKINNNNNPTITPNHNMSALSGEAIEEFMEEISY